MKMGLRWFGEGYDTVSLDKIRQVPGVRGVINHPCTGPCLGKTGQGPVLALHARWRTPAWRVLGIESVNVHDAIKAGLPAGTSTSKTTSRPSAPWASAVST